MSYKPEVLTAEPGAIWTGNGLRFATKEEARTYVTDLACRWTGVRETRVVKSDEPVNYKLVDGQTVRTEA